MSNSRALRTFLVLFLSAHTLLWTGFTGLAVQMQLGPNGYVRDAIAFGGLYGCVAFASLCITVLVGRTHRSGARLAAGALLLLAFVIGLPGVLLVGAGAAAEPYVLPFGVACMAVGAVYGAASGLAWRLAHSESVA